MFSPQYSQNTEFYVLDVCFFLKFTLHRLLQNLLPTEFVHKPSFMAISCDASYTSCTGLLPEVQYHSTDCWLHQLLNRLVRRGRRKTPHCSSTAPSPPGPTDLLCHCKWEKNLALFIIWTFSQERTQCQLQCPAVCQHLKREPGAGQHPKGLSVEHDDNCCALDCLLQSHHNSLVNNLWTSVCINRSSI